MFHLRLFFLAALGCVALPLPAATFTVNNTADVADASPGNGVCETVSGNGVCTLRSAIQEAGHLPGVHTIVVPAGTYALSATPACSYRLVGNPAVLTENMSALCVTGNVTITGAGSNLTIIDAGGSGGATCCGSYPSARGFVFSRDAIASLSGVTIQNGFTGGSLTVFGGSGINNQGKLTLSDIVLTANSSSVSGGGIYNTGSLAVDTTLFSGNTASSGAGLYNDAGATATITGATFSNGVAVSQGAAIFSYGSLAMSGSTLVNNSAGFNAGAIFNNGPMSLTNVTISGNNAVNGAGISNNGTLTANNVTLAFNHATGNSGGILNTASFTMRNTILAGNSADQGAPDCSTAPAAIVSQGHNLVSNTANCSISGVTATNIYNVAAGLAAIASNGGATQTHALLSGSPAIDAGDSAAPGSGGTSCAAIDQRGYFRPQGAKCDIGAFERSSTFALSGIIPLHAANTSITQAFISGSALVSGAVAKLRRSGQADIIGNPVSVQDGNAAMAASFDLTGKAAGVWDLVVTNPDNTVATLPGAFTVDPTGSSKVWVEVAGPAQVRPGFTPTYLVAYGNRGNADALAVPITFSTPASTPLRIHFTVTPPPAQAGQVAIDWTQVPVYVTPGPSNGRVNIPFLLPVIPAGFSGVLTMTLKLGTAQEGDILAFETPAGDPYLNPGVDAAVLNTVVTGAAAYAQANLAVSVPSSATSSLNQYATNQLLNAVTNGRQALTDSFGTAPLVYSLGQFTIDLAEYAATLSHGPPGLAEPEIGSEEGTRRAPGGFSLSPRDSASGGRPGPGCGGAVMVGGTSCTPGGEDVPPPEIKKPFTPADCLAQGKHHVSPDGSTCVPDNSHCPLFPNPLYTDPDCTRIPFHSSVDPNAKWGPFGSGTQHFRRAGGPFHYDVEFENLATASLAAQQVVVTDQLDTSTLDTSTFSLGPISFGPYTVTPPPGTKHYITGLDLRPANNLQVKIDAGLNLASGLVTWRFTSLDPTTGEATTDPAAGFLPPDVTPPQGQAHLLFSILPKSGLSDGTTVCNRATVVFDSNPAINTQNWCNTFDFTPPVSHVQSLPAMEATANFTVQWTGSDAAAGIGDYTIYVSDNGGSYTAWISNNILTQSTYTGVNGHTYRFYSIARDLVGNVEGAKTAAEASTVVNTGAACASDVSAQFSIARSGFRLNNATKRFQQTVTLTRTAAGVLAGPFVFAIENLSANATLYSPAGTTTCIAPGSAYLVVNPGSSWTQGQVVTLALEFVNPTNGGITYTPALLAGATR